MPRTMTEDEARKTLCPKMSRPLIGDGDHYNELFHVTCYASGCAWWDWVDGPAGQLQTGKIAEKRVVGPRRGRCSPS